MIPVLLVYGGAAFVLAGLLSLFKPGWLGLKRRLHGAVIVACGLLIALAGFVFPAPEVRSTTHTHIDQFMPNYQFHEFHYLRVAAPCGAAYTGIRQVTADEILLFRTLIWIRRFGQPGPESILNPPPNMPLLEVATGTTFRQLAEEPGREIVVGTVVAAPLSYRRHPQADQDFHQPGFALATMNFLLQDDGPNACLVSTETRVFANDSVTRARFARYWRVIYPGSALIRRMWLRAIKKRAEMRP